LLFSDCKGKTYSPKLLQKECQIWAKTSGKRKSAQNGGFKIIIVAI
jgi:hypothetical protein